MGLLVTSVQTAIGWIDSWEQSTQLANYWRRHFNIPEVDPEPNYWQHYPSV